MDKAVIKRLKPTIKQTKTLQFIKEGDSIRNSMIKAGYAVKTANKGREFFKLKSVQGYINGLQEYVVNAGLTNQKMADKFKEWIDAEKITTSHTEPDRSVPDYDTQLKAYDRWEKFMNMGESGGPKLKRKLTVEEFVNTDEAIQNEQQ